MCFFVIIFVLDKKIPAEDLKALMKRSYGTFTDKQVVPTKTVGDMEIMELFHGPTYAFKDVALQVITAAAAMPSNYFLHLAILRTPLTAKASMSHSF